MAKTKDVVLVEIYDREIVELVTAHLEAKLRRKNDLERKDTDRRNHLRKNALKRMEKYGRSVA